MAAPIGGGTTAGGPFTGLDTGVDMLQTVRRFPIENRDSRDSRSPKEWIKSRFRAAIIRSEKRRCRNGRIEMEEPPRPQAVPSLYCTRTHTHSGPSDKVQSELKPAQMLREGHELRGITKSINNVVIPSTRLPRLVPPRPRRTSGLTRLSLAPDAQNTNLYYHTTPTSPIPNITRLVVENLKKNQQSLLRAKAPQRCHMMRPMQRHNSASKRITCRKRKNIQAGTSWEGPRHWDT